jgi:predicted aminopeptidase
VEYGNIVPAEPNNAFLVSISVYTQMVPGFERLLAEAGGNLPAFYKRVGELAKVEKPARELALR